MRDKRIGGTDQKPWCCVIECEADATWQIFKEENATPDDFTHACEDHVGSLLYEGRNKVSPIGWEP